MSERVIRQFSAEAEEVLCGEEDCANRWQCLVHGEKRPSTPKSFKPVCELVIAGETATLTCHNYWQGRGRRDGRAHGD